MKEGLRVHHRYLIRHFLPHSLQIPAADIMTLVTTPVSFCSPPVKTFNENFNSQRTEADILSIVSKAEEFEQLKVRGHHL